MLKSYIISISTLLINKRIFDIFQEKHSTIQELERLMRKRATLADDQDQAFFKLWPNIHVTVYTSSTSKAIAIILSLFDCVRPTANYMPIY